MTKIIGLTGGIGSGKTTIAHFFRAANIPIYIADDEARSIMQTPEIIESIQKSFGSEVFNDGDLVRENLAKIVFDNPEKLKQLNAIIHPAVRKNFQDWVLKQEKYPFVIYESAILFESGGFKNCDLIITVIAPVELRIQRVIQRDKITHEQVLKRINAQWNDEQRIAKSNFVIDNSTTETSKIAFDKLLKILNNY